MEVANRCFGFILFRQTLRVQVSLTVFCSPISRLIIMCVLFCMCIFYSRTLHVQNFGIFLLVQTESDGSPCHCSQLPWIKQLSYGNLTVKVEFGWKRLYIQCAVFNLTEDSHWIKSEFGQTLCYYFPIESFRRKVLNKWSKFCFCRVSRLMGCYRS